ncbi:PREDICTED: exonuclease V-like [Branchiostoma belcheri]|uniref:Exonuclease V-like n=1 Tax=Branchiostoma belcheri TaxID=7741 RepID=A0A6P4XIU1_BRABE|nr:PREDICTED: exonuclease V-like [Branchiostoma belcheri]
MAANNTEKWPENQNIGDSGQNTDDWASSETYISDEELLRAERGALHPQINNKHGGSVDNVPGSASGSAPAKTSPPKSNQCGQHTCPCRSSAKCPSVEPPIHDCQAVSKANSTLKIGDEGSRNVSSPAPPFSESLTDEDLLEAALTPPSQGNQDRSTCTTTDNSQGITKKSIPPSQESQTSLTDSDLLLVGLHEESSSESKDDGSYAAKKRRTVPLYLYRWGYLCVTDICSQSWCEQQMVYTYAPPGDVEVVESAQMKKGATMHKERELEVHDIVPIKVTSAEDSWAVKLLNMIAQVTMLQRGQQCVREIHVFGEPFDMGIFIVGVIDELRYSDNGHFELLDFKTRGSKSVPSKAQQRKEGIQVGLYKRLFDDLVLGKLKKESILKHLKRSPDKPLGEEIIEYGKNVGIACTTFGELLDMALLLMAHSDIPCIDSLKIEYRYQDDDDSFMTKPVEYNDKMMRRELGHYFDFWKGDREVEGVQIEEAWKCGKCPYADLCEWRQKKEAEIQSQLLHK